MEAVDLNDDKNLFAAIARKISRMTGVQLADKQSSRILCLLNEHLRNLGDFSPKQYWDYLARHEDQEIPILIALLTNHPTDTQHGPHAGLLDLHGTSKHADQKAIPITCLNQISDPDSAHRVHRSTPAPSLDSNCIIAIGASTGGTEALSKILRDLPSHMPPILIVQHIPEGFSRAFAERLNRISRLEVKEAVDGDILATGRVLLAPGDKHMTVIGSPGQQRVQVFVGEKLHGHRPSVDILFRSVAEQVKSKMLGVILTGMGRDGADGLLQMKKAGALTIGQDAASSVAYGMPKIAHQLGAVDKVFALNQIASELIKALG